MGKGLSEGWRPEGRVECRRQGDGREVYAVEVHWRGPWPLDRPHTYG